MTLLFNPAEVIRKKRDAFTVSPNELNQFMHAYLSGVIPDYQMSAFLMAIVLKGMNTEETATLTRVMLESGARMQWPENIRPLVVDKHSTGGIGDKTSILIVPLCMGEDVYIPMMAGRGLGHTGGTVDKLESFEGFRMAMTAAEMQKQVLTEGAGFFCQSDEVAPLDRRLYALRDVTATVESKSLICASILSKKLAESLRSLVMDIKVGSGAFFKEITAAKEFCSLLKTVCQSFGVQGTAFFTRMSSPLGQACGNALEIKECLKILRNEPLSNLEQETLSLSLDLSVEMVALATRQPVVTIRSRMQQRLKEGKALQNFQHMIQKQGGDFSSLDHHQIGIQQKTVTAQRDGRIATIDGRVLGLAIIDLGGGRLRFEDKIDYGVGIECLVGLGATVSKGQPLYIIHHRQGRGLDQATQRLESTITYDDGLDAKNEPLILDIERWEARL